MVKWFSELIEETLKCSLPQKEKDEIENIVRTTIFHSTLDWQTKGQLKKAIKEANAIRIELLKDERLKA